MCDCRDGSPDLAFDRDGEFTDPIGICGGADGLVVTPDGRIVVAGTAETAEYADVFAAARIGMGAADLVSVHGDLFTVDSAAWGAGQLMAVGGAADWLNRLQVDGADFAPTVAYTMDYARHTVVTGTAELSGLNVHREITVPNTGNEDFARTMDVFENTTVHPITATVRIIGNLGSDSATSVFQTSDGDASIEPTDRWIGTDDAGGIGAPAVIHYVHGPFGLQPDSAILTGDNIEWTYTLTVPAGKTLRLAQFTVLADHREDATAAADALISADGFAGQAAVLLSQAELDSIANFHFGFNAPPVLSNVPNNATIPEVQTLSFHANATDIDLPAQNLTFSLADLGAASTVPIGASIDPNTGVFTWTPSESQGPGVYRFKVQVNDGLATTEQTVELTVSDDNAAPVLATIGNKSVDELATLTFKASASDPDFPVQTRVYSLDQASRNVGMRIDPATGVFAWTPTHAQLGKYQATIIVTDNGVNPANRSASESITITVGGVASLPLRKSGYNLLLRRNGANIQLVNPADVKHPFWEAPAGKTFKLTIRGLEDAADTLTADYANGPLVALGEVVFDAKGGKAADKLVIRNSAKTPRTTDDSVTVAADHIVFQGTTFATQGVETVSLDTGKGDDTIVVLGLGSNLMLIDSAGEDTLDFSLATHGMNLALASSSAQRVFVGQPYSLTLKGTFENVVGTSRADVIKGNSSANRIEGRGGNDTIYGSAGDDSLFGGDGYDWLYGDAGNDRLYGEMGNNVLMGGDGNDLLDVAMGVPGGSRDRNLLIGGRGADMLQGGDGEEILIGGTTSYDSNATALSAIMAEWTLNTESALRLKHLTNGIADPTNPKKTIQLVRQDKAHPHGSVFDDKTADRLFGWLGSDCFFDFGPKDEVHDP